jgi:GTP cyclohydrolase I
MNEMEDRITELLKYIGEDPDREGLLKTPYRVIKSYNELFSGYKQNPKDVLTVTFESKNDEMVFCNNIDFYSMCEHHMLPFFGKCHIGYLPQGRVVGLSKLARLVEIFARRLQIQENMTTQIAEAIMNELNPLGVGVVVEAQHLCMKMRGVRNHNSYMKTSKLLGNFKSNNDTRAEFFSLIKEGI